MNAPPIITLTTDFGVADPYVGTMKGVMLTIAHDAHLVDITHEIPPQDVLQTAFVIYTACRFFPPHTVHLVVVDPGVGSTRRAIAVRTPHGFFVGPDNGVFSYILTEQPMEAAVQLAHPRYRLPQVSHTFHGRDIFAPAAAHLATGVPIDQFGPAVSDPVTLPPPALCIGPDAVSGEVLYVDHFGNAITSIGRLLWRGDELLLKPAFTRGDGRSARFFAEQVSVTGGEPPKTWQIRGVHRTYANVEPGEELALVGSTGHLELAVRQGSGARELGLQPGDSVELRW